ncbi:MAG: M20/M25/M40 family metallo-hydrolase [Candidatus Thorarchaeota archaeon]
MISSLDLYNESEAFDHIQSLAFNRTASSTGETEALNYIEQQLKDNNIQPEVEHFNWTGPMRILMRTSYVLILIYLILFRMFLVVIAYFIIKNMFERFRKITFVSKEQSKNIFTLIPSKQQIANRPLVIISAHYDSISTNLPYKLQVIIFFLYRLIVFFYAFIVVVFSSIFLLDYFDLIPLTNFMVILIIFTSIGGVFISIPIVYLVFKERESTGSVDNASGVAISIELAKIFNQNPLEKMDILFLWSGAEEWGMKGSKKFCKKHFQSLQRKYDMDNSFNINIDMVGTYIGLLNKSGLIIRRKINRSLNDTIKTTADQLEIPLKMHSKVIKPKSDYKMFEKYAKKINSRFQVSMFHSAKDSKYIHSLRDTPDKCSIENLNGCINICDQTLRNIDLRD